MHFAFLRGISGVTHPFLTAAFFFFLIHSQLRGTKDQWPVASQRGQNKQQTARIFPVSLNLERNPPKKSTIGLLLGFLAPHDVWLDFIFLRQACGQVQLSGRRVHLKQAAAQKQSKQVEDWPEMKQL